MRVAARGCEPAHPSESAERWVGEEDGRRATGQQPTSERVACTLVAQPSVLTLRVCRWALGWAWALTITGDAWTPDDAPRGAAQAAQRAQRRQGPLLLLRGPTVELPPLEVARVDSLIDHDGTQRTPLLEDPGRVRGKRFPRSKLVGSTEF